MAGFEQLNISYEPKSILGSQHSGAAELPLESLCGLQQSVGDPEDKMTCLG